jgi:hypothetical protein
VSSDHADEHSCPVHLVPGLQEARHFFVCPDQMSGWRRPPYCASKCRDEFGERGMEVVDRLDHVVGAKSP